MKINKQVLQDIFDIARNNLVNDSKPTEIDGQQFAALCYLKACAGVLGVKLEVEKLDAVDYAQE